MSARPASPDLPATLLRAVVAAVAVSLAVALLAGLRTSGDADADRQPTTTDDVRPVQGRPNPVTPGNFRGLGFDQCLAPTQQKMDRWLYHSPFLAVGIYISGDSRACRDQPNLTPTWVRKQLRRGWKLLPITLGPQASCSDRFPRYGNDPTIRPNPGKHGRYGKARKQGRAEANTAADEAGRLGIVRKSTLWYDLEGFDHTRRRCRESALAFLTAWTNRLHARGYQSGVYSSAGSGIKILDDARVNRTPHLTLPDMIWIARWDGKANVRTHYIRDDGWMPGSRVKQFQGGHDETWGKITINIDRNYLRVGKGRHAAPEKHCDGVRLSFRSYPRLVRPTKDRKPPRRLVRALQCLLTERGVYDGRLHGFFNQRTADAVHTWQERRGFPKRPTFGPGHWVALHAQGAPHAAKIGSTGPHVRRLQRALNAAVPSLRRPVNGIYNNRTRADVRGFQKRHGLKPTGIVTKRTWGLLRHGRR